MPVVMELYKNDTGYLSNCARILVQSAALLLGIMLGACHYVPLTDSEEAKIDTILCLMDVRLSVATKVAQVKWNNGAPIDDGAREAKILAEVAYQSIKSKLDKSFAEKFFQTQIEANKLFQRLLHEQWRREARPPFAHPADLALEVRPILDRLTPGIIIALRDIQPIVDRPEAQHYLMKRAPQKIRGDFKGEVRALALQALLESNK
jgi:chorismate mutase